ncbi:MAG: anti-sigma factor [Acidobacteria bacterium]|nr:anti-sigma factor [Acidobacteriota bacterium]
MSAPDNNLRDLYELYALGLLEEPEKSQIEAELQAASPEARKRMREALENNAILMANVPLVEPPSTLRNRVLAVTGVEKKNRAWMAVFATAFAGLAAAFFIYSDARSKGVEIENARALLQQMQVESAKTNSELARARHVLSFLNAAETKVVTFGPKDPKPPRGRVLLHPDRGVLLIASNLPPAPSGKIYEMWIIRKNAAGAMEKPVPAGLFQTDNAGNGIHLQEGAVPLNAIIAVTLEPESGSSEPTTTPLFAAGA